MNYKYQGDEPPQQPPGYVIQIPFQQNQMPPQEAQIPMNPQMIAEIHNAKIRSIYSATRLTESDLVLRGLTEIRMALNVGSITVASDDKGSTERPPLEPAFDEINRGKLQNAYLALTERYINLVDNFLVKELKVELTHEIKKDGVQ